MDVKSYIYKKLEKEKLHFSLFDPENFTPEKAAELAKKVESFGTAAIMIGGSTSSSIDGVAKAIKEAVKIPIILFPNSAMGLTKYADAVFFMSLLNSRRMDFIVGEQIKGAPLIEKYNLEPIGMGYIVVNTGILPTSVEKVADVRKLETEEIVNCALAAQYFGMNLIYLEAGSGAQNTVPDEVISKVKEKIKIPLIVGGGIKGPRMTLQKLYAGADIIVTGTVIERAYGKIAEIIDVVKNFKIQEN